MRQITPEFMRRFYRENRITKMETIWEKDGYWARRPVCIKVWSLSRIFCQQSIVATLRKLGVAHTIEVIGANSEDVVLS